MSDTYSNDTEALPIIRRRSRLFPRDLREMVTAVTKEVIDARGKVFATLLRGWPEIIGAHYQGSILLRDVSFPNKQASNGTLHLDVAAHLQAEIPYITPLLLEQCAAHLGYRAIEKIVAQPFHPSMNDTPSSRR